MTSFTFFIIFVPILAIILLSVNLILAPHNPYDEKKSTFECGFHSFLGQNRQQFSISFFIFALLFLLFDLEILLTYPYSVSHYTNEIYGLIIMIVFFIILTIGFAFEFGKKALKIDSRQMFKNQYISNHHSLLVNSSQYSSLNSNLNLGNSKILYSKINLSFIIISTSIYGFQGYYAIDLTAMLNEINNLITNFNNLSINSINSLSTSNFNSINYTPLPEFSYKNFNILNYESVNNQFSHRFGHIDNGYNFNSLKLLYKLPYYLLTPIIILGGMHLSPLIDKGLNALKNKINIGFNFLSKKTSLFWNSFAESIARNYNNITVYMNNNNIGDIQALLSTMRTTIQQRQVILRNNLELHGKIIDTLRVIQSSQNTLEISSILQELGTLITQFESNLQSIQVLEANILNRINSVNFTLPNITFDYYYDDLNNEYATWLKDLKTRYNL